VLIHLHFRFEKQSTTHKNYKRLQRGWTQTNLHRLRFPHQIILGLRNLAFGEKLKIGLGLKKERNPDPK
jgi:hypothetical protein